jgi:hypothetical protein
MEELVLWEDPIAVGPSAKALDVLQAVYRNPRMSLHTRLRAAAIALPFESPKLQATAIIGMGLDFPSKLERAIRRSDSVRLIAKGPIELAQPEPIAAEPEPFRRRV